MYKLLFNFVAGDISMIIPEYVLMNHDIHGQCVSDVSPSHFWIRARDVHGHRCNFKILKQPSYIGQGTNTPNFVIKNVTETCQYTCGYRGSTVTKQVIVTGIAICIAYRIYMV